MGVLQAFLRRFQILLTYRRHQVLYRVFYFLHYVILYTVYFAFYTIFKLPVRMLHDTKTM